MAAYTLLLLLALVTGTSCSHFSGSTITYTPRGRDQYGFTLVDLHFRENYMGSCSLSNGWACYSGNCGHIISTDINGLSSGNEGCQSEGILAVNVSNNNVFEMQYDNCCWIRNVHSGPGKWNLVARVDLGIRSDTRAPNRPPVITILHITSVAQTCPHTIKLLTHDQDGDRVRCRYDTDRCKVCASHSNFRLDEDTCELHYLGQATVGTHVFEIVVEDFPTEEITVSYTDGTETVKYPLYSPSSNSTAQTTPSNPGTAISRIPLHFVVKVKPPVNSCTEGAYLPTLVFPSPECGEILNATAGKPLRITLAAEVTQARLTGIVVSGPSSMSMVESLMNHSAELTIEWTPTEREVGDHVPLCFSGESKNGDDFYQSEMRCVILRVGPRIGEAHVVCTQTTMTIEAERSLVQGLSGNALSLLDASCVVSSNDTHVFATTDLDSCGTVLEEDGNNVTFINKIVKAQNTSNIITRTDDMEIEFLCSYHKNEITSSGFKAQKRAHFFTEEGFGRFSFLFEFFHSRHFDAIVDPGSYPIDVRLSEMIFIKIKSTSSLQNTVLFVESCKATPEDNPNHSTFYSIIDNGCAVDSTVQMYSSPSNEFRFGMQAFKFTRMLDEVYISCSVMLCLATDPNTRCAQGCIGQNSVAKRSVAGQTAKHDIMQGPLRLKRNPDNEGTRGPGAPGVNINLNFLSLTVLAGVALVCGVVFYKIKKSGEGHKQLPLSEI